MIDRAPEGKSWLAWMAFILWSAVIFLSVPLARSLQRYVSAHWGRSLFTDLVLANIVIAAGAVILYVVRRRTIHRGLGLFWLLGVAVFFVWQTLQLRAAPEEALHFIEYGVLGFLAFHALSYRVRDSSLYVVALCLSALVGALDEVIQWLTPERIFDYRDMRLNAMAALLVLMAIAFGLRPAFVKVRWAPGSAGRLCCWAAMLITLLGLCLLNTPRAVDGYSSLIPSLDYLRFKDNAMSEYGFLFKDPEIGTFKSRFDPDSLKRADEERSMEAARILNLYQNPGFYKRFLGLYTPVTDPFVHEARVHLFRRDHYLNVLWKHRKNPVDYRIHATVAYREQQIMEKYFPNTLRASNYKWDESIRAELARYANTDPEYVSPVSQGLITTWNERQVLWGLGVLLAGCLAVCWRLGRGRSAVALLFWLILGGGQVFAGDGSTQTFKMVFFTDVHTRTEWNTPEALSMAAEAIRAQNPDLIIGGGDYITEGFESGEDRMAPRWDAYFHDMHQQLFQPVLPAIGNHDLVGARPVDGSAPSADPRATFKRRFNLSKTYWSTNAGGYHFVFLDSIEVTDDALQYRGCINPEQLGWLRQDLLTVPTNTPVIAVTHLPLRTSFYSTHAPEANRVVVNHEEVLKAFDGHRLLMVLQGHMHVYETLQAGSTQFVTGGAICGQWWRGPWRGTPEGFCVIQLNGNIAKCEYVSYGWVARRPKDK
ncbi:MAG: VanZ family protein [Lentisphaerota bacterium]